MRNRCLFGLGLVFAVSLISVTAFAFSFTEVPAGIDTREPVIQTETQAIETETAAETQAEAETQAATGTEAIAETEAATQIQTTTETETEAETETQTQPETSISWSADEAYLLAKLAMAEAEGEDTVGKALVIRVVLNRLLDDEFPDTIREVIYARGQFSPIGDGRYDSTVPDEDCYKAVALVETGWDESLGATFFESRSRSTWHSRNLQFLFQHGNHYFYKKPE